MLVRSASSSRAPAHGDGVLNSIKRLYRQSKWGLRGVWTRSGGKGRLCLEDDVLGDFVARSCPA